MAGLRIPRLSMTRGRRWLIALLVLVLLAAGGAAGVWWALKTNQLGRLIEDGFSRRPLPGVLHVTRTELHGVHEVVLHGVALSAMTGAPPVVTVRRIVVAGELWQGDIATVRLEGVHVNLSVDGLQFLHELIRAEVAHKSSEAPSPLRIIAVDSAVMVNGAVFLDAANATIDAIGPRVVVDGSALAGTPSDQGDKPEKLWLSVTTEGKDDDLHYRMALKPGERQGMIVLRPWCERLASLKLLPPIPADANGWLPERIDGAGSAVLAQDDWEHFTGDLHATWAGGQGQAALRVDRQSLRLDKLAVKDAAAGELEGGLEIGLENHLVEVTGVHWHPGPKVPIPKQVPTEDVLALLPQAKLRMQSIPEGWGLSLELSGTGKAVLAWSPKEPFVIDGANVPLALLQKFLPEDVTLAAGRALKLHVVLEHGRLEDFYAEVEQTRVLWRGWGLGTVDGKVTAKPSPGGYDAEVVLPAMGTVRYTGGAASGTLHVDLAAAEALMVRLKGPSTLPDLRGAIAFTAQLRLEGDAVSGHLDSSRLTALALPDRVKMLDATINGDFTLRAEGVRAHLLGQLTSGSVRIPGSWLDLARHHPIFNATFAVKAGTIDAEDVLVRATDERGEALPDGYSAGLHGSFSTSDLAGTITGVVDHADLAWLTSSALIPVPDGHLHGQCAVTFTAMLAPQGISRVDGFFLPLDADLTLGPTLKTTGINGAVKFRLARADEAKPAEPKK
jgi:hypothetical protein